LADFITTIVGFEVFGTHTYSLPTVCANGGTPTYDGDPFYPTLIGCTLNGVPQSLTGGGCNNVASQPVLNADFTANPLYNASPLVCVIAETYSSLSQASSGAEVSRVVGGIHTPVAVTQALSFGNSVGSAIYDHFITDWPPSSSP
jgi:hypothetical protein